MTTRKATKIDRQLAAMDPSLRGLLSKGSGALTGTRGDVLDHAVFARETRPLLDPDEAERLTREYLRDEVDDLRVAWRVVQARANGHTGGMYIEHICYLPHEECARGTHGYTMGWGRLPGPLTREAHDEQERRIAEFPDFSEKVMDSLMRSVRGVLSDRATQAFIAKL